MLQNNRLVHLDVIKGLAILFVIIHHGLNTPIIPEVIDSYHMPLFVFVSGYIVCTETHIFVGKGNAILEKEIPTVTASSL